VFSGSATQHTPSQHFAEPSTCFGPFPEVVIFSGAFKMVRVGKLRATSPPGTVGVCALLLVIALAEDLLSSYAGSQEEGRTSTCCRQEGEQRARQPWLL
jgi:hypothetical protein